MHKTRALPTVKRYNTDNRSFKTGDINNDWPSGTLKNRTLFNVTRHYQLLATTAEYWQPSLKLPLNLIKNQPYQSSNFEN